MRGSRLQFWKAERSAGAMGRMVAMVGGRARRRHRDGSRRQKRGSRRRKGGVGGCAEISALGGQREWVLSKELGQVAHSVDDDK